MTSLPIESNAAANDAPVSVASDVETKEEDLEQIQRDAAAAQQKLTDETQARLNAATAQKEQKWLDREKRAAEKAKEAEAARKMEEARKMEARKMEQVVSPEVFYPSSELTCIRCATKRLRGVRGHKR